MSGFEEKILSSDEVNQSLDVLILHSMDLKLIIKYQWGGGQFKKNINIAII